jgi:hypothetical protein
MKELKEGFYWLKYLGKWIPAEYKISTKPYLYIIGDECPININDKNIEGIGERIMINKYKDTEADGYVFCGKCGKMLTI